MEVRPTYLIMVTSDNHNKYYNCFPNGDWVNVEYGRVNTTKQTTTFPISQWNSKISSKLKKGYQDITDLRKDLVEEVQENGETKYKEIDNKSVRDIVEKLQRIARNTIRKNYTVSASAVTQEMVDKAQNIIDKLITLDSVNNFNDCLLELFTAIPRKMSTVSYYLSKEKEDFNEIIKREQDLLDVMRGQIYVKPEHIEQKEETDNDNKTVTILEELGLEMEDVTEEEVEKIKNLMNESKDKFRKAWRVTNDKTQKRFDEFIRDNNITNTKLLFHGSRNENWFSIIKTGLVLRPTNAVITGSMYGKGCYFSPKCRKSIGYTSLSGSYWAHGSNNTAYMALFEVAYGKPFDVYTFDSKYYELNYDVLQKMCPNANCLHAHADKGMLRNDEIVVYKEEQMTIKYLIEIGG